MNAIPLKYWAGPYAVLISTLYLWGYWGSFDVNILDFIGTTEIIKAALYPIASAALFLFLGALLGELFFPAQQLPEGGGGESRISGLLRRFFPAIAALYLALLLLYFLLGPLSKWNTLPVLIAIAAYLPVKASGLLKGDISSERIRSIAIFLFCALPPFAYGRGALEAHAIISGKHYLYTDTPLSVRNPSAETPSNAPRYIGKSDDRYFFFDPESHAVLMVASSTIAVLTFKSFTAAIPRVVTHTLPQKPKEKK